MPNDHYHVLVAGLPTAGKTSLSKHFKKRGKVAYDTDKAIGYWEDKYGNRIEPTREQWENPIDIRWNWDEAKLQKLLSKHKELYLFGRADNMYDFAEFFDKIYYLKPDKATLVRRLEKREAKKEFKFGRTREQRELILGWKKQSDKEAKKLGLEVIDATLPHEKIFEIILRDAVIRKKNGASTATLP